MDFGSQPMVYYLITPKKGKDLTNPSLPNPNYKNDALQNLPPPF